MDTKMIRVLDSATEYVAVLAEFTEIEELELLDKMGWDVDNVPPKLIVLIHSGLGASAAISHFSYPPYDLNERSIPMPVNNTTIQLAWNFRQDGFPDQDFDVRDAPRKFGK